MLLKNLISSREIHFGPLSPPLRSFPALLSESADLCNLSRRKRERGKGGRTAAWSSKKESVCMGKERKLIPKTLGETGTAGSLCRSADCAGKLLLLDE